MQTSPSSRRRRLILLVVAALYLGAFFAVRFSHALVHRVSFATEPEGRVYFYSVGAGDFGPGLLQSGSIPIRCVHIASAIHAAAVGGVAGVAVHSERVCVYERRSLTKAPHLTAAPFFSRTVRIIWQRLLQSTGRLRSQRRHDMAAPNLALRSAHRGPAAVAELGS